MRMIVIYQKSTGKILNYSAYNETYLDGEQVEHLRRPSLEKAATNHSINISDLEVKEWLKTEFTSEENITDYMKDNINDVDSQYLGDTLV